MYVIVRGFSVGFFTVGRCSVVFLTVRGFSVVLHCERDRLICDSATSPQEPLHSIKHVVPSQ